MISVGNVIRMKVPFPTISSDLAIKSHMYICKEVNSCKYEFVKCQTLKPYMLMRHTMQHYHDESPNPLRNPFTHETRIDCDKTFNSSHVKYDDRLITPNRQNVVQDILEDIEKELLKDGYKKININEIDLVAINELINWI